MRPFPFSFPGPIDPSTQYIFEDFPLYLPFRKAGVLGDRKAEPWSAPILYPKHGGPNHRRVYEAVGFALSQWEELEARLQFLFVRLLGLEFHPDGKAAMRRYESAVGTVGRMDELTRAANYYVVHIHDQEIEAELERVIRETKLFTLRRNEIAHGSARQVSRTVVINGRRTIEHCGFCQVPVAMLDKILDPGAKRDLSVYTPLEIKEYGNAFMELRFSVENVITKLRIIEN